MEMTGLDPVTCVPVEVAIIVTDAELNEQESNEAIIHQSEEALSGMDPFVVDMHTKSGLLGRIRESKRSLEEVDAEMASLVLKFVEKGQGVLAGNSIHSDRAFIKAYFPKLEESLHYRMIDVSSLKELVRRWYGEERLFAKTNQHTAMADIRESLAELAYYRNEFMKGKA